MMHGRLPWLLPEELNDAQRTLYGAILGGPRATAPRSTPMTDDEGRFHGPFNAMLIDPNVGEAAQQLGAVVRYRTALSDRSREIAILEVARLHRSNFEFYAHASVGLNAGLTGDEIGALAAGSGCASFDAKEDLIRETTRSLVESHDLNDALYARAVAGLGEVVVADLVVLVGFYEYTALALRVFRVPLPAGVSPTFAGGDA